MRPEQVVHTTDTVEKAKAWGWKQPKDDVLAEAAFHLKCAKEGLKTLDVMEALGLIQAELKQRLLKQLKPGVKAFDLAMQYSSSRQGMAEQKNRVLAPTYGVQYLHEIDHVDVRLHPLMSDKSVMEECERMQAVLVKIQDDADVLVFSEFDDAFTEFKQMGRAKRLDHPIIKMLREAQRERDNKEEPGAALTPFREVQLHTAVSRPDVVAVARKKGLSGNAESDSVNLISVTQLRSEKERALQVLGKILEFAASEGASDIHISPKEGSDTVEVLIRVHKVCQLARADLLPSQAEYQKIKGYLTQKSGASVSVGEVMMLPDDGNFMLLDQQNNRFNVRCSFIPDGNPFTFAENLISVSLRLSAHETGPVILEEKNVPEKVLRHLRQNAKFNSGSTYIVGPTGSGKTVTLFGMVELHRLLYGHSKFRLSIEDPIERNAPGIAQHQVSKKAEKEFNNPFEPYERNILRHDPDLILIGEVRDQHSAVSVAQQSATGHYVLTSIHADDCALAVERIMNMVPANFKQMVVENLNMLVGQRLVSKLCPECKVQRKFTEEEGEEIRYWLKKKGQEHLFQELPEIGFFKSESGCKHCSGRGSVDVIPVYEVVDLYPEHKRQLLSGSLSHEEVVASARAFSIQESIIEVVKRGDAEASALLE